MLPTRHVHYGKPCVSQHRSSSCSAVVRLPSPSDLPPDSLLDTLSAAYKNLLAAKAATLAKLPEDKLPPKGAKRDSYNIMLTVNHMHLIPRSDESFIAPREESEHREKEGEVDVVSFILFKWSAVC